MAEMRGRKLTGEVIDLKCGMERPSIRSAVVNRDARSHHAGSAQARMDISNGRTDLVERVLRCRSGIFFGPVHCDPAIQVDALGNTDKLSGRGRGSRLDR